MTHTNTQFRPDIQCGRFSLQYAIIRPYSNWPPSSPADESGEPVWRRCHTPARSHSLPVWHRLHSASARQLESSHAGSFSRRATPPLRSGTRIARGGALRTINHSSRSVRTASPSRQGRQSPDRTTTGSITRRQATRESGIRARYPPEGARRIRSVPPGRSRITATSIP